MTDRSISADITTSESSPHLTVLGLFEDSIDAEHVLSTFRKDSVPSKGVSILVGDKQPSDSRAVGGSPAVGVSLSSAGLGPAGDWLTHLVSLVIPGSGVFLMAGPIGAVVAATRPDTNLNGSGSGSADNKPLDPGMVQEVLVRFGYGADEAGYLAHRLAAGSILIGLTTPDPEQANEARRVFSDQSAVHIGTNWTDTETMLHAQLLLRSPVESAQPDDSIILDSVGVLVGLCSGETMTDEQQYRGMVVIDSDGEEAGIVDDLLAEIDSDENDGTPSVSIRYVVVAFGGILGIGRGYVAVPAECVTLDDDPVRLSFTREKLKSAPTYQGNAPFSRHQEELICGYFGCTAYWTQN